MKTLKVLALLAAGTLSASQLNANITMTIDPKCGYVSEVEIWNLPGGYANPQYTQSGQLIVTFPSSVQRGTMVTPIGIGFWQPAKNDGILHCENLGIHKEVGKPYSR